MKQSASVRALGLAFGMLTLSVNGFDSAAVRPSEILIHVREPES